MYARILRTNSIVELQNKIQRQYFVYFYGKYLEYAWLPTSALLKYAGLDSFIQNAETAVQQVDLSLRHQLM